MKELVSIGAVLGINWCCEKAVELFWTAFEKGVSNRQMPMKPRKSRMRLS